MAPPETTSMVHVVASVNMTEGTGAIHYVNPSNVRSNKGPTAGMASSEVSLVLRDTAGEEIARVHPEIRYQACADEDSPRIGLIQQDLEVDEALAEIDLVRDDTVLDSFRPPAAGAPPEVGAALGLGPPLPGRENRRRFGAEDVEPRGGVTYMIQVRPDNREEWQTLSIGRSKPEFEIDKNQFPGASSVSVRVVQSAGFTHEIIDERTISLE